MLAQITAPHFVAGIILANDYVIETAPILKYMNGWPKTKVWNYCRRKKWRIKIVAI